MTELFRNELVRMAFKSTQKNEKEKILSFVQVVQKTLNLVILRCYFFLIIIFAEDGKEMYQNV